MGIKIGIGNVMNRVIRDKEDCRRSRKHGWIESFKGLLKLRVVLRRMQIRSTIFLAHYPHTLVTMKIVDARRRLSI